jgi:glutathione S-transferase
VKLYTYPGAPNPRRVHIYLAEKGIDIPFETVDIMKRENRQPAFLEKVNALGGLPVLELDDGTHIAESVAICRYFEALHPEPPLFGVDAASQGCVEMWLRRVELNLMVPVGMVWIHGSPLTKAVVAKQLPEAAEQNRAVVRRTYRFLDTTLAERPYLAGDGFSMADILALCSINFATQLNDLPPDPAWVDLARWHQDVSSRPSAKA